MMSNKTIQICERLKGRENFETWKFGVENLMILEGYWASVQGTEVKPEVAVMAKAKLILMIEPELYVHVREATTAKEVWDKLCATFDDKGLTRRVGLLRDLTTTRLENCESVADYVNKIIGTSQKLSAIGMNVEDEWIGSLLLTGLPEKFQPMIMAIESSGIKITADVIKMKLLQDADNYNSASGGAKATNQALMSKEPKTKKFQKRGGFKCYGCGAHGHSKKHCPNKGKTENTKTAFCTTFAMSKKFSGDVWYIDSGSTTHMSNNL